MEEREGSRECNDLWDALRFLGDASYAIMPEDIAHRVGELKKNFWGGVRWLAEKETEWIDARVKGGDRLREEWRRGAQQTEPPESEGNGI
jgi:hypothetical protein